MDPSEFSWLAELEMDNSLFLDQCDFMDSIEEEVAAILGQGFDGCLPAGNNSSSSSTFPCSNTGNSLRTESLQLGSEQLNPDNYSNFSTVHALPNPDPANYFSAPMIINFGKKKENPQQANPCRPLKPDEEAAVSEVLRSQGSFPNPEEQPKRTQTTKKPSRVRPPSQTYDHIIAERKRREQLSQRFLALSAIVPGLKKTDKASVLGDAIKYLKHLQERVKTLEEQATKQTVESVVLVKKSQIMVEDEGSSDKKSGSSDEQPLPEIEARVCKNHILLRVHCEKQKGVLLNLLGNVESLSLAVVNTNVTPFGSLALDITIVAEMEKEFNMTVKEVVKRLRATF